MVVEHRGMRPQVDPSAWIAPTAVVCGDVSIGAEAFVATGAALFPGARADDRAM
jgi:carbonic anhydrase/acetyltransferase-like protein (isoleucine patch superfamily)